MAVSRDPGDYRHTTHSKQQRRERGIDNETIADVIKNGEERTAALSHQRLFVQEFASFVQPVGVVVDARTGDIITVEWVNRSKYYG